MNGPTGTPDARLFVPSCRHRPDEAEEVLVLFLHDAKEFLLGCVSHVGAPAGAARQAQLKKLGSSRLPDSDLVTVYGDLHHGQKEDSRR